MLCASFQSGEFVVYAPQQGAQLHASQTDDDGAFFTAFSPQGALSIRKRQDRVFQFGNVSAQPQFRQTLPCRLCCALIAPRDVFLGAVDGRVFCYTSGGELLQVCRLHTREVLHMHFSEGQLLTSSADGSVAYSLGGERVATLLDHFLPVHFARFWRQYVVSAGEDKKVRVSEICTVGDKRQFVVRQVLEFEHKIEHACLLGDCIIVAQSNALVCQRLMAGCQTARQTLFAFDEQPGLPADAAQVDEITCLEACDCSTDVFVGFKSGNIKAVSKSGGTRTIYTQTRKPVAQMQLFATEFYATVNEFSAQLGAEVVQDFAIQGRRVNLSIPPYVSLAERFSQIQAQDNASTQISRDELEKLLQSLATVTANFE